MTSPCTVSSVFIGLDRLFNQFHVYYSPVVISLIFLCLIWVDVNHHPNLAAISHIVPSRTGNFGQEYVFIWIH